MTQGQVQETLAPDALNFKQFRTWLDLNPYVRTMFLEALNPQMWAIDPSGKPLPKNCMN